jgi:cell division protein FtsZ
MKEMIKFDMPKNQSSIIKVLGVGGGGSNAVNHMFRQGIKGVDFIICNTDAQAMESSPVPVKVQLGDKGLGAGSVPSVGKEAAEQKKEEIREILEKNTQMLFITAGMGGGTGTGAAPVIASVAKELNILTVGIVTQPFSFEGKRRTQQAEEGIKELKQYVDTLLIISNDKIRELFGDLKLSDAFHQADDVLTTAARGIAEIITVTGYINVDFEDVKTVMKNSGKAIMGCAQAEGQDRAMQAVKDALASPLLNDNEIEGASNVLLYITSGEEEISMDEVTEITDYIQREAKSQAEIIWGNGYDETIGKNINITLIATGFDIEKRKQQAEENKILHRLNDDVIMEKPLRNNPPHDNNKLELDRIELISQKPVERVLMDEPVEIEPKENPGRFHSERDEIIDKLKRSDDEVEDQETGSGDFEGENDSGSTNDPGDEEMSTNMNNSTPPVEENTEEEPDRTFVFEINQNASEDHVDEKNEEQAIEDKQEYNSKEPEEALETDAKKPFEVYIKTTDKNREKTITRPDRASLDLRSQERIERLKKLSMKLKSEAHIEEMENQPAYMRKNMDVDQSAPSEESEVSRYSLYDEDGTRIELRSGNSFLHDNVD